jgi:choline dehydrogenase-like flavoprotein
MHNYIIVGSGAGGSVAFSELTKVTDVLLMEEGKYSAKQSEFHDDSWVLRNLYRDQGLRVALGSPSLVIGEGVAIGGSTEINGGVFWELPNKVSDEWRNLGWSEADSSNFCENNDFYSKILKVNFLEDRDKYDLDSLKMIKGATKLGWRLAKVPRIVDGCQRANRCAFGCPNDRKMTMSKTLIPQGIENGGQLFPSHKLLKISRERDYIKLFFLNSGKLTQFKSKNVILSCGSLETIRILENNKLVKGNELKTFFHSNLRIVAEFEDDIYSQKGTIYTRQISEFLNDGILIMPTNFSPETLSLTCGNYRHNIIRDLFRSISKLAIYTCQVRTKGAISKLDSVLNSVVQHRVNWHQDDNVLIRLALLRTVKLCFASGAKRVLLPISDSNWIYGYNEALVELENSNFTRYIISTVHLMGGSNYLTRDSIINPFGELNIDSRISLSDSSILPSSTIESPQVSIMSLAKQFAMKKVAKL